jgi:hypothetical protein
MKILELDNPNIWWMHPISPIPIGENKYQMSLVFFLFLPRVELIKISLWKAFHTPKDHTPMIWEQEEAYALQVGV